MDPDKTLHELRSLSRRLLDAADDGNCDFGDYGDDIANMAELFQHLDRWIQRRGLSALPEAWKSKP